MSFFDKYFDGSGGQDAKCKRKDWIRLWISANGPLRVHFFKNVVILVDFKPKTAWMGQKLAFSAIPVTGLLVKCHSTTPSTRGARFSALQRLNKGRSRRTQLDVRWFSLNNQPSSLPDFSLWIEPADVFPWFGELVGTRFRFYRRSLSLLAVLSAKNESVVPQLCGVVVQHFKNGPCSQTTTFCPIHAVLGLKSPKIAHITTFLKKWTLKSLKQAFLSDLSKLA